MNFCKKCGTKLINNNCPNCQNLNTVTEEKNLLNVKKEYTPSPKNTFNKIGIIIGVISIISICGFFGFKTYFEKKQEAIATDATNLLKEGDFEKADELMEKYQKDDKNLLSTKEVNKKYLILLKECESKDFSNLMSFKAEIEKSEYWDYYRNSILNLLDMEEKFKALDNLDKNLNTLLKENKFDKARELVVLCRNHNLTSDEKATVDRASENIDLVYEKESFKKAQKTIKDTYLERYRNLSAKYNDAFFNHINSSFSEAEKSAEYINAYNAFDKLLNDVWKDLPQFMSKDAFETLRKAQIKWIEEKMATEKNIDKYSGGKSASANVISKYGYFLDVTKTRCYKLITEYMN